MNEEEKDRSTPLSIDEIVAETKAKPVKPKGFFGYPIAVGSTGISLRKGGSRPHYNRDDEEDEIPDGETVGARIK